MAKRICRVDGCDKPVYNLFADRINTLCIQHHTEALAQLFEQQWEGDTLRDISEGEQLGAMIRDIGKESSGEPSY